MLHRCTDTGCPYLGQPSPTKGCKCHKADEQVLREQRDELLEALEDLMASWPEGSLPNGPVCVKAANALRKAKGEA